MKITNLKKYTGLFLLLVCLLSLSLPLIGQNANPIEVIKDAIGAVSWDQLLTMETAITSALIIVAGYLSPFVPFLRKIPNGAYRVAAFALIVIIALVKGFGFGTWAGSAVAYFFSTSLYELVFKWFGLGEASKEAAANLYNENA